MNGLRGFLLVATCLLISSTAVYADDDTHDTGVELARSCNDKNSDDSNALWMYCVGLVSGIDSGLDVGVDLGLSSENPHAQDHEIDVKRNLVLKYCIPTNATLNQRALVVSKYLKDHPESLNEQEVVLVYMAFATAWPCTTPKT